MARHPDAPPSTRLAALLQRLAAMFALAGGIILVGMALLVVASVLGRAIFLRPVPGDFEIVGFFGGISIFLFLPYCYLQRGNVVVDLFLSRLSDSARQWLDRVAAVLLGCVALVFAWRMLFGLADTFTFGDISMIVGMPLWWAYPVAVSSFALLAVSAFYSVFDPGVFMDSEDAAGE